MTSVEAPFLTSVIQFIAFEAVAYDPTEFEYPFRPELSINAPINTCKSSPTPATDGKYGIVCFSTLKITKCFSSVGHWELVYITVYSDYCRDCGGDN